MGSGAETVEQTVKALNAKGEKLGVLKVRMFRPFSVKRFAAAIPQTAKVVTVLDRTKELGAMGEPLYQEVSASISEARANGLLPRSFDPVVLGGRYGLGSKEFTPAMVKGVFDNASAQSPKNHFSVGINDDVTRNSVDYDESFVLDENGVMSAVFFGLGADGTVGANKNTIKIIGNGTPNYAQAYFVYDSKKSGGLTVSHLRFGPNPIRAPYLINNAQFVACHQFSFMQKYDVLACAAPGAVFLLNSIYDAKTVWNHLNCDVQRAIIEKKLRFYVIDAYEVAKKTGMGGRINTVMQTCYFAVSGVLPREEAIEKIKAAIEKTYSKKGRQVVEKNFAAVDASVENCHEVEVPASVTADCGFPKTVADEAPDFVKRVTAVMMREQGDKLPVSAFPVDGTWPSATTQWEKRNIAIEIPGWNPELCIQCTKCATICPHAAIRAKFYKNSELENAPEGFKHAAFRSKDNPDCSFTIQVAPEDCTGCGLCATVCPGKSRTEEGVKALMMVAQEPIREREAENFKFFLKLPNPDRSKLTDSVKDVQFRQPLFEFSGSCAGCGETPYVKMLTQLFGDRLYVANATGCSSIYSGNLPTTPYCVNEFGRGPAWANSLFEDNAEFGFGYRISLDKKKEMASEMLVKMAPKLGDDFVKSILEADQTTEAGVAEQRKRVEALKEKLASDGSLMAKALSALAGDLVNKTVWILGGDGWAYDIGYGGLDHGSRQRQERKHNGYGHRGLLQHRRPDEQVHAPRRGCQVRLRRQVNPEERPRNARHRLRQRVRGADRPRRKRNAGNQGDDRSQQLRRHFDNHRLQPLHIARLQSHARARAAESGGRFRLLAALPLRPAQNRARRKSVQARLPRPEDSRLRVHESRKPLQNAPNVQSRTRGAPRRGRAGIYQRPLGQV